MIRDPKSSRFEHVHVGTTCAQVYTDRDIIKAQEQPSLNVVEAGARWDRACSALLVELREEGPGRQKIQRQVSLLLLRSDEAVAQQIHDVVADFLNMSNLSIRQGPAPGLRDIEGVPGICMERMSTRALASGDVVLYM